MRIQILNAPENLDEAHVVIASMQYYLQPGNFVLLELASAEEAQAVTIKAVPLGTGAQVAQEALARAEAERLEAQKQADAEAAAAAGETGGEGGESTEANGEATAPAPAPAPAPEGETQAPEGTAPAADGLPPVEREQQDIEPTDVGDLNSVLGADPAPDHTPDPAVDQKTE